MAPGAQSAVHQRTLSFQRRPQPLEGGCGKHRDMPERLVIAIMSVTGGVAAQRNVT